jgi:hypothetical protein
MVHGTGVFHPFRPLSQDGAAGPTLPYVDHRPSVFFFFFFFFFCGAVFFLRVTYDNATNQTTK